MNILHTERWCVAIPPEWWAERDEDGIVIGDRDDVGSIEITTLCQDAPDFSSADIEAIAVENAVAGCVFKASKPGDFAGFETSYREDGAALREWYIAAGSVLLFVTYCCDLENAGMDDAAVNEILDTLLLNPAD